MSVIVAGELGDAVIVHGDLADGVCLNTYQKNVTIHSGDHLVMYLYIYNKVW